MYLKSITLKGFKSFPDRTRLEFGPGVSVIVGPNGSGKSNVTDAVLWALGEQSPLAVRGQSMQDMVFAGGHGVKGRSQAHVEIVIDNAAGRLQSEFAEIAISREVDRSGEGTYRLNGARCRLVDLLEVLSDSGLGKEMHSVISQGKVEAIVHSKPEDRTAMIEEAAGLTKHRKRRHRAQLKLRRTQDNLDRALDVEREARSRLRPLKRQAEAAELHARLERQSLEARLGLVGDDLLGARAERAETEQSAATARARRDGLERDLMQIAHAREETERSFAEHGRAREELAGRLFAARSAADRLDIRLESCRQALERSRARLERSERALAEPLPDDLAEPDGGRLAELETELARLEEERSARLETELADVEAERVAADESTAGLGERIEALTARIAEAAGAAQAATTSGRGMAERMQEQARVQAKLELELEALEARLRLAGEEARASGWRLADRLDVDAGYETALAAALGGRLGARVVATVAEAAAAVEHAENGGTRALVSGGPATAADTGAPPAHGAERLRDRVRPAAELGALADRLLARVWVVERIADVPEGFSGVAVTRGGVAYDGASREAWRIPEGGAERAIADRARREELHAALERARADRRRLQEESDSATLAEREAEQHRDVLETELRELRRRQSESLEAARRCAWVIEQRRRHGVGPEDARRAALTGEISAERRLVERLAREREERAERRRRLEALAAHDRALVPVAERLVAAIADARTAVIGTREALEQELAADEAAGEEVAAKLRELATREYELQAQLRESAEALTHEEVRVAQIRDRETALDGEVAELAKRLGLPAEAPDARLGDEERADLAARLERLERRRERLGPVNPLAAQEYEEAVAHVEELEGQRKDLETALGELQGLIRETDRMIRESFSETFEAAAKNFEDVVQRLFPGGSGRLRKVSSSRGPRPVLGGEEEEPAAAADEAGFGQRPASSPEGGEEAVSVEESAPIDHDTPGIEIEVTPAGKTTRRLSLLSGGEKSLVALAFMFAVFLARPCPFYILDEVEAALDDANIDRFLSLVRAYSERTQFIIVTHQRRTMEAADVLYGVSMGKDGVSKVVSRRLESQREPEEERAVEAAA